MTHTPPQQQAPDGDDHATGAADRTQFITDVSRRRQRGEQLLAPVSFRHLEALASRMHGQTEPVQRFLLDRAKIAAARHDVLVQHAQAQAQAVAAQRLAEQPEQMREVRRLLSLGDLHALRHLRAPSAPAATSPLTELNRHIDRAARAAADPSMPTSASGRVSMKSLRQFRETWARMATQDQLKQAMARAPNNAGPLNSHQLVLRSLALMQEVSPAYLHRFMNHLDALLWLDQVTQRPTSAELKPARISSKQKAKNPK